MPIGANEPGGSRAAERNRLVVPVGLEARKVKVLELNTAGGHISHNRHEIAGNGRGRRVVVGTKVD